MPSADRTAPARESRCLNEEATAVSPAADSAGAPVLISENSSGGCARTG